MHLIQVIFEDGFSILRKEFYVLMLNAVRLMLENKSWRGRNHEKTIEYGMCCFSRRNLINTLKRGNSQSKGRFAL